MSDPAFIFPPPPTASLPVAGSRLRAPVGRIFCVGRNYADHAIEMGGDPDAEPPFFFMKPATALCADGADFPYPAGTSDLHHEVELAVLLHSGGDDIPTAQAMEHVAGYAVALDMTRRDLQAQAKAAARPWEVGKSFDLSAPCGALVPAAEAGAMDRAAITLHVDGALRQSGDLAQMIWKTPEIIAFLSRLFTLAPGDLILTGTPAGVAAVQRGAVMEARIDGLPPLSCRVV